MALKGKQSVTDATGATTFGPDVAGPITLINRGPNRVYIERNGATAVDDIGFNMELNEAINTRDIGSAWVQGVGAGLTAVCASGETASLYWHL